MGDAELAATPQPFPPRDLTGATIGRFAIGTRLGGGGMGEVYRAEDTKLKRPVALKRVTPAHGNREHFRRRFLREAECASRINDRHIAGVYDVLEENGELFLVMEYVEGQTLRERIRQPMTLGEFLEIAIQCAEALAAAHARDVVHRDIKPDNIMLTPGGEVKVLDFGVAKHLPRSDQGVTSDSLLSRSTSFSGTPAYMAPEVLLEKDSDGRADIFSLGAVFYEALTGRHPFLADSFMATSNRILNYTPPPPSHFNPAISEEADRIVGKMLAKEPRARYATAADLLVDLNALSRGLEHPDRLLRRSEAARPASLWAIGATAAVLLVMVAGAVPSIRQPILERAGFHAAVSSRRTLVVLPCRAISADQAAQVYCDGLTESLTERLARSFNARGVQVAPAKEVRTRRVTKASEARLELDAVAALEIVLSQSGNTVQIEYALLDTRTEQPLDRQSVRSDASDPFAQEEEVARGVARMLEVALHPLDRRSLAARDTQVPEARDFYLRARGSYLREYDNPAHIDLAIQLFQRALALDPQYAQAHAGLGEAYLAKYAQKKEARWIESARESCQAALAVNPKLAAARLCLGALYNTTGDYEQAVSEYQAAVAAEPSDDIALRGLGTGYENLGNWAEAEKAYLRAIEARKDYWAGYSWLGAFYHRRGRYADAARMFEQVVALAPNVFRGYNNLGGIYLYLGRYPEAIEVLKRSQELKPTALSACMLGVAYFYQRQYEPFARHCEQAVQIDQRYHVGWANLGEAYYWAPGKRPEMPRVLRKAVELGEAELKVNARDLRAMRSLAGSYALLGEKRQALAYLQRALSIGPEDPDVRYKAAFVYNLFGETDAALEWIEKAVRAGYSPHLIRDNAFFDNLKQDSRYQQLLASR
jgi:serine/threonine protein kinase/Flp pilus assembly protein TadD